MQLVCLSGLGCVGHRAIVGEFGSHFLLTDSTTVEMQGSRLVPCV